MAAASGGSSPVLEGYSSELKQKFENPEFTNWLKVTLALGETGKGIKEFTDATFKQLQLDLSAVCTSQPGVCRDSCSKKKTGKDGSTTNWCVVCQSWKTELLKHHIPNNPKKSWAKYDSSKWPTDPAEIRKLFQRDGWLKSNAGPTDPKAKDAADLSTLMFILDHCTKFSAVIPKKLIKKIRDVRNTYLGHNQAYILSEAEKKDSFACMTEMLNLPEVKKCAGAEAALNAVQNLEKMNPFEVLKSSDPNFKDLRCGLDVLLSRVEQGDRLRADVLDSMVHKQDKVLEDLTDVKAGQDDMSKSLSRIEGGQGDQVDVLKRMEEKMETIQLQVLGYMQDATSDRYSENDVEAMSRMRHMLTDFVPGADVSGPVTIEQLGNMLHQVLKVSDVTMATSTAAAQPRGLPEATVTGTEETTCVGTEQREMELPQSPERNPISEFMDYAAKNILKAEFKFVDKGDGLGFIARACLGEREFPPAEDLKKKDAKTKAAKLAMDKLKAGDSPKKNPVSELMEYGHDSPKKNPVSELMEYGQKSGKEVTFHDSKEGPDHQPRFIVYVKLGNRQFPCEESPTNKKEARQKAAEKALEILRAESTTGNRAKEPVATPVVIPASPTSKVSVALKKMEEFLTDNKKDLSLNCGWVVKSPEGRAMVLKKNPVSVLKEFAEVKKCKIDYNSERTGPDHAPVFKITATLGTETFPVKEAVKKKDGRTKAAIAALEVLWKTGRYTPDHY